MQRVEHGFAADFSRAVHATLTLLAATAVLACLLYYDGPDSYRAATGVAALWSITMGLFAATRWLATDADSATDTLQQKAQLALCARRAN